MSGEQATRSLAGAADARDSLHDGTRLDTLHEARAYIIALPEGQQLRNAWQKAAELLMVAATSRESIAAATKQIVLALFIEGKWLLPK